MKFWIGFLVGIGFSVVIAIALGAVFTNMMLQDEGLPPARLTITPDSSRVQFNFKLTDLYTGQESDSRLFTNKVVLLNFWERWCVPCRKELPSLRTLYNSVQDSTIVFAIISTQDHDSTKADSIIQRVPLPYYHMDGVLPDLLKEEILPRTYIFDQRGKLVAKEFGARTWDDERVVRLIDSLKRLARSPRTTTQLPAQ